MPLAASLLRRHSGPAVLGGLVVAQALLWWWARPAGQDGGSYLGQLLGVEAVLLMSLGVILVSTLPWLDTYFDGIDRAAVWHRRVEITGLVLLLPHILMSHHHVDAGWANPAGVVATVGLVFLAVWAILPRWRSVVPSLGRKLIALAHDWPPSRLVARLLGDYEIWRAVHRTTGIFLAIGFAHGLADASPFGDSALLRWSYVAVGGIGLLVYAYRELLARRGHGLRDYQVREVRAVGHDLTEIVLRPLGRPLDYRPGQFAMLHLEAKDGWHRHPFTLASSPAEPDVRVTIKALGDYTSQVSTLVRPGMPAVLSGPHGRFVHGKGTDRQVWIAGGVGVTPFLSWLRSLDVHPPPNRVDFFYSVSQPLDTDVPYLGEIREIAARHLEVEVHVVRSAQDGRLTADRVLELTGVAPRHLSVFMCGPGPMVRDLQQGFRAGGVSPWRIHREHFDWR